MEVELGFVEKAPSAKLRSKYFPSKVGGFPSWLDLKNLPTDELLCDVCKNPCVFLMQMYSPGDDLRPDAFHRTIFLFVCKNPECCERNKNNGNFKVLRNHLGRKNDFYSFDPPASDDESDGDEPVSELPMLEQLYEKNLDKLCLVCGCRAPKHCANCKEAYYCCRLHQELDWKAGHKKICKTDRSTTTSFRFNLPEYELVNEPEVINETKVNEDDQMKAFEEYKKTTNDPELSNKTEFDVKQLEQMAMTDEDSTFTNFKELISHNPDQVLRYQRNGSPVWVSSDNVPNEEDIPNCPCGSKRSFEFQVLPQLLNHLSLDDTEKSIDWGTLVVYTCEKDCNDGAAYHSEYLWKQDVSDKSGKKSYESD